MKKHLPYALAAALLSTAAMAQTPMPLNSGVTQATISQTICAYGWTRTVRPEWPYTDGIKNQLLANAGHARVEKRYWRLDHIVPLELGGDPISPNNMQLQTVAESDQKDEVEDCLRAAVCSGSLDLDVAREAIWRDWRAAAALCRG